MRSVKVFYYIRVVDSAFCFCLSTVQTPIFLLLSIPPERQFTSHASHNILLLPHHTHTSPLLRGKASLFLPQFSFSRRACHHVNIQAWWLGIEDRGEICEGFFSIFRRRLPFHEHVQVSLPGSEGGGGCEGYFYYHCFIFRPAACCHVCCQVIFSSSFPFLPSPSPLHFHFHFHVFFKFFILFYF